MPGKKRKAKNGSLPDPLTQDFICSVVAWYRATHSLERTAEKMKIAYAKVRKILITADEYRTVFSTKVGAMRATGLSTAEISKELNTTTKRVNAFLPYEKAIYKAPERTMDATKSEMYRKRIRVAKEKFVVKKNAGWSEPIILLGYQNQRDNAKNASGGNERRTLSDIQNQEEVNNVNDYSWEKDIKPIRLHLELKNELMDNEMREILRKHGKSSTGYSLSRDILIPSDMSLHALHYAIQKLFGWQNSHMRSFRLPDEVYREMTSGTVKGWAAMSGVLFYGIRQEGDGIFWDEDYQGGSIKVWLRKKYTGPYMCADDGGHYESAQAANQENLFGDNRLIAIRTGFEWDAKTRKNRNENKVLRMAPIIDLTLVELDHSVAMEQDMSDLLERLEVTSVLAEVGDTLAGADQIGKRRIHTRYERGTTTLEPEVLPITHTLLYHYDNGDDWQVVITRPRDCADLQEIGHVTAERLAEAEAIVTERHRPVCLYRDGISVMDDVGGLSGFANFLRTIHDDKDVDERRSMREWAAGMGWSTRKVSDESVL